jgi:hypothetical protein
MAREYLQRHASKPNPGLLGTPRRVAGTPTHRFDISSIYILDCNEPEFTLFKNGFSVS